MDSSSLCSRKRPCGGALLQLHQETQSPRPACKKRCEEGALKRMRRSGGGRRENREPDLQKSSRTQNLRKERFPHTGTRNNVKTQFDPTARSGLRFGGAVQSSRPEVRVALIRTTRFQTSAQTVGLRRSEDQQTRIRSRSTADQQETEGLVSETRTSSRRRSERVLDPETLTGKRAATRTRIRTSTRSVRGRTDTRRRKIQLSMFTGRGQLRLSITPEAGQLIIHIHEAQGLMGKYQRSCDSFVKVSVTSDLRRMKTPTVLNNKNPQYNHSFTLCVSDKLLPHRLLVSVLRRRTDSRYSQLIGCMSFGIGSVVSSSKLVTGWFHLLGEEFGLSKHLRVTSQRQEGEESEERATHCADLRRTPDSAPDTDLNPPTAVASMPPRTTSTAGLKDRTLHNRTSSRPLSLGPTGTTSVPALFSSCSQRPTVSIARGKDGFGFTICSDCPVRVQAVDPGGPAHQSGLQQGDSVLQLNGLPVETWKCVDLAHAIRSCPSQIVLVVWRGLPELRPGCEALVRPPTSTYNMTTGRKLLPHPAHSKHVHRRDQGSRVHSTLGALGSLWRDRKEEEEEEEEEEAQEVTEFSPPTTTLRGTRVRSSNGDNYIILSPVSPGGQLLQPVYHDGTGTLGRLYQTHPSRGQSLLHDPQPGSSRQPFTSHTSTLPPPALSLSSSAGAPSNYGNYQNCTIVQSHLPCSAYGSYMTLAPKTLIFPVFVQPLDLCSPDRTLLMSEEMILHQADSLPAKVTVLIYSDLLLLTREDEAGRCNVLQSPLYLNTLQLREVPSEPLLLYLLQTCSRCVFSLESFSIEQKVKVRLCLHDNIHHQQVATETALPSDFDLLSVGQSDPLCRSSSPYTSPDPHLLHPSSPYPSLTLPSPFSSSSPSLPSSSPLSPYTSSSTSPPTRNITALPHPLHPLLPSFTSTQTSPVWKERGRAEEEERRRKREADDEDVEERQQGEGESASETSESAGGVWGQGILLSPSHLNMKEEASDDDEDKEEVQGGAEEFRPAVLRRSLSEGYLLQEPRSPRFLSDSTIHQLTRPVTFDPDPGSDPDPPSPHTLRKQLTREGGSLHQMLLLLNGPKESEFKKLQLKKKTKTLASDVRSRLAFLRRRKNSTCFHGNSLEKALRNNRPSLGEVLRWAESLEALLTNQYGLAVFRHFLRSEFSEENLDFWLAVERFKMTRPVSKMATRAAKIYDEFISISATRQVNVDSAIRESTNLSLHLGVSPSSFQLAQEHIFSLMETDSYPRFLRSHLYTQLANQDMQNTTVSASQSEAGPVPVSQS